MSFKKRNFIRDKALGSQAESLLLDILSQAKIQSFLNQKKTTREYWDVETKCGIKFEVKYDLYSARSGNIAIEFWNPKSAKPSGLNATLADYWIHVLPDQSVWLAPLQKLKDFCLQQTPIKTVTSGGDDNSSMYLYPKDLILPTVFVRLDKEKLSELIEGHHNEKRLCDAAASSN